MFVVWKYFSHELFLFCFSEEGQIEGTPEIQSSEGAATEGTNEETEHQTQERERAVTVDQEQEGTLATVAEGDEEEEVEVAVPSLGDESQKPVRMLTNY